jgi:hypothetical protein
MILAGFPNVKPDCFYTDASLLLGAGGNPANSVVQSLPQGTYRWFSWHIATWQPSDTLDKYVRSCEARLRDIR